MIQQFPTAEPHGSLQQIFDDAWFLTGSVQFKPLLRLPRNMVVLRNDGELTVINSVRLDAAGEAALDALGRVTHVMKIGFHGMDDAYYLDRYKARHWLPGPAAGGGSEGRLTEGCELPIPGARVFEFNDTVNPETALLLERDGGLLITCDSVQHWAPSELMSAPARLVTRLMGFQKPAQIGPPWRKKQTPAGGSLRSDFARLADLPFTRLIGGHGGLLEAEGPQRLKESVAREFA